MTRIFTICLIFLCASINQTFGQHYNKISPELVQKMDVNPQDYHDVIVLLSNRVDTKAFIQNAEQRPSNKEALKQNFISELKKKSTQTQPQLIEKIKTIQGISTKNIIQYWIVNALKINANQEGLLAIAELPEVSYLSMEPIAESDASDFCEAPIIDPNNHETGLTVINAPKMWALGYTGYGQKAYVYDNGVEIDHPALRRQFNYHNAPMEHSWKGQSDEPYLCADHGTHVTGTIMGLDRKTNDTIGVAFNAQFIYTPQFTSCGSLRLDHFTAYQWAINPDGDSTTTDDIPQVMNQSGGWTNPPADLCEDSLSRVLFDAFEILDLAYSFSAGNAGPEPSTIGRPAYHSFDLVKSFAVGNLNGNSGLLSITSSSSRGPTVCPATDSSLLIKPEVSAPGTDVRSSELDGTYGYKTGTSMSAPHVAGAILLLAEAFPNIPRKDLMLALYFSAVDLGKTGEDNDYGMGLIDVYAAYNYLIDQGNTPVPPISSENDVILLNVETQKKSYCNETFDMIISFENAGKDTLRSLKIYWHSNNGLALDSLLWTGKVNPDRTTEVVISPFNSLIYGKHEIMVELKSPNGKKDPRDLNNRFKRNVELLDLEPLAPSLNVAYDSLICFGARAILDANESIDSNQTFKWFNQQYGSTPIETGPQLITTRLFGNAAYYLDLFTSYKIGKVDADPSLQLEPDRSARGLLFDTYRDITLKSIKVFPLRTGNCIIRIEDVQGNTLGQKLVKITDTIPQRVEMNFHIPKGISNKIYLSAGDILFYEEGNAEYPYKIEDIVSIKNNNRNNNDSDYYYFYDWEIEAGYGCDRTKIDLEVSRDSIAGDIDFSIDPDTLPIYANETVQFVDLSENAISWAWNFDNDSTSTVQNPTTSFALPGNYDISLFIEDESGCANYRNKNYQVMDGVSSVEEKQSTVHTMRIYPNPSNGKVNFNINQTEFQSGRLFFFDVTGQTLDFAPEIDFANGNAALDLSNLSKGFYFAKVVLNNGQQYVAKLVRD